MISDKLTISVGFSEIVQRLPLSPPVEGLDTHIINALTTILPELRHQMAPRVPRPWGRIDVGLSWGDTHLCWPAQPAAGHVVQQLLRLITVPPTEWGTSGTAHLSLPCALLPWQPLCQAPTWVRGAVKGASRSHLTIPISYFNVKFPA